MSEIAKRSEMREGENRDEIDSTILTTNENSTALIRPRDFSHLWVVCDFCDGMTYHKIAKEKMYICEFCDSYIKMTSSQRIALLLDSDTWEPMDQQMRSCDPIHFDSLDPLHFDSSGRLLLEQGQEDQQWEKSDGQWQEQEERELWEEWHRKFEEELDRQEQLDRERQEQEQEQEDREWQEFWKKWEKKWEKSHGQLQEQEYWKFEEEFFQKWLKSHRKRKVDREFWEVWHRKFGEEFWKKWDKPHRKRQEDREFWQEVHWKFGQELDRQRQEHQQEYREWKEFYEKWAKLYGKVWVTWYDHLPEQEDLRWEDLEFWQELNRKFGEEVYRQQNELERQRQLAEPEYPEVGKEFLQKWTKSDRKRQEDREFYKEWYRKFGQELDRQRQEQELDWEFWQRQEESLKFAEDPVEAVTDSYNLPEDPSDFGPGAKEAKLEAVTDSYYRDLGICIYVDKEEVPFHKASDSEDEVEGEPVVVNSDDEGEREPTVVDPDDDEIEVGFLVEREIEIEHDEDPLWFIFPEEEEEEVELEDDEPYIEKIKRNERETGLAEAVETGTGELNGIKIAMGVMDFRFVGGSMGSVVGEKMTRLIEHATKEFLPIIIVCASGGARMQEGSLSLMQMAKISSALYKYRDQKKKSNQKLFYISILTTPTTGGVTASFAMLGDIIIAEPDAYIAFAGKRVIEELFNIEVPEGSQEAEVLFEKGFLDLIVPRNLLKSILTELLQFHSFRFDPTLLSLKSIRRLFTNFVKK